MSYAYRVSLYVGFSFTADLDRDRIELGKNTETAQIYISSAWCMKLEVVLDVIFC